MEVSDYFRLMVDQKASDLFIKTGSRPSIRVDGRIHFVDAEETTDAFCREIFRTIAEGEIEAKMTSKEMDLAAEVDGAGRFRVNVFHHRGEIGFVFRHIQSDIPTFEELNLPLMQMKKIAAMRRGLVLITGIAG
ncbi:MAG: type IV pili twitching motility protein PilT, partial [Planctomycetota bacterium]